jgi:hypothetical protein
MQPMKADCAPLSEFYSLYQCFQRPW